MMREDESIQLAKREQARTEGGKRQQSNSIIGFYDLEKTLGEGSFARVKAATHVLTGSKVAIKIVDKTKLNEDMAEKLRREVRIMKTLNHPHIVRLYEVMETTQEMFLVMEYAEGGELLDYLVAHGRMREKDARKMFRSIVSAIAFCHTKHVIHRDLKAENLLLDMGLSPKIADFGFSNVFSEDGLLSTSCGTPAYAAPELFKGRDYTGPEIDIWSLGVVLYILISGTLPFLASTFAALKARVISGAFVVPVFMSSACEDLVRKMLETDPEKRITMEGVLKHPWFNDGHSVLEPFDDATFAVSPESHENILTCMEELGFPRERVNHSLQRQSFDHIWGTYHLLATQLSPRIHRDKNDKTVLSQKHQEMTEKRTAALAAKLAPPSAPSPSPAATAAAAAAAAAAASAAAPSSSTAATSPSAPTPVTPVDRVVVKRARGYTVNTVNASQIRREMGARRVAAATAAATASSQKTDQPGSASNSRPPSPPTPASGTTSPSPPSSPVEPTPKMPKTDKGRRARAISLQTREQRPALATLTPPSPTTSTASSDVAPEDSPSSSSSAIHTIGTNRSPIVSSPLNPNSSHHASKPVQPRERRLSFKDKFKKTLGLSLKETQVEVPAEPKSVRFHFSVRTTSAKSPAEIVTQIERVMDSFQVAYERENFLFLAKKGGVAFEMEVCKLPRMAMHGVRIKRLAGDSWEYKAVCTDLLLNMKL